MSGSIEEFPEAAQKMIRDLRAEAAEARVAKNTAVDDAVKATQAKLEAEFTAKLDAMNSKVVDLEKGNTDLLTDALRIEAALNVGVSPEHVSEFAKRLRGASKDEIFADAENAKSLYGTGTAAQPARTPAIDPSIGLGNENEKRSNADLFGDFFLKQLPQR